MFIIEFRYNAHSDWMKTMFYQIIKHGAKVKNQPPPSLWVHLHDM